MPGTAPDPTQETTDSPAPAAGKPGRPGKAGAAKGAAGKPSSAMARLHKLGLRRDVAAVPPFGATLSRSLFS